MRVVVFGWIGTKLLLSVYAIEDDVPLLGRNDLTQTVEASRQPSENAGLSPLPALKASKLLDTKHPLGPSSGVNDVPNQAPSDACSYFRPSQEQEV